MIWIFTKTRHIQKIKRFLDEYYIQHKIFTIHNLPQKIEPFEWGISYCFPRLITEPLLSTPKNGFINFHPAPLPEYKGGDPYSQAVKDKVMSWGCTAHKMNEKYDEGPILQTYPFALDDPPQSREEIGAIAHYFNFKLFKSFVLENMQY